MSEPSLALDAVTLRLVDASLNRGTEALRVVEDVARFAWDDKFLAASTKDVRHDVASAVHRAFPLPSLLACRDTAHDVGTDIQRPDEYQRAALADVLAGNFKRAQQAVRSLEECCKLAAPRAAVFLEQLRYRLYSLEQSFAAVQNGRERLERIRVCVLVDGAQDAEAFGRRIEELVAAGPIMFQLRDAGLPDRVLWARAKQLVAATRNRQALAIINDRADIAAAASADGVHVGQEDLPVHAARRILGPHALIGVSTHSLAEARQAVRDGANYLGIGPVFPSPTKQFASFLDRDTMRHVIGEMSIPGFAIGGIRPENVRDVITAGAGRIAVQHAVWSADHPRQALDALQAALPQDETLP